MNEKEIQDKKKSLMLFSRMSEEEAQKVIDKLLQLDKLRKELPKDTATELAQKIRPVFSGYTKEAIDMGYYGKPDIKKFWADSNGGGISSTSYVFEPLALEEAYGLQEIAKITTYHTCGYPLFLKPSTYEVLYQIPEDLRKKVVAFEITAESDNVNVIYNRALDRHVLTTVLYSGEIPEQIKNLPIIW